MNRTTRKLIDLAGLRVGLLVVKERAPGNPKNPKWLCLCDCGQSKIVRGDLLRAGKAYSCGCVNLQATHGQSRWRVYKMWAQMRQRCENPNNTSYANYGARGVSVCDRWKTFSNFYADMGDPPPGHSLDRFPNINGNYEPGNCRWATAKQQARNIRTNRIIVIDGVAKCLAEWCEFYDRNYGLVLARLKYGWPAKLALETPTGSPHALRKLIGNGER